LLGTLLQCIDIACFGVGQVYPLRCNHGPRG
jgi:hypothetical protein